MGTKLKEDQSISNKSDLCYSENYVLNSHNII